MPGLKGLGLSPSLLLALGLSQGAGSELFMCWRKSSPSSDHAALPVLQPRGQRQDGSTLEAAGSGTKGLWTNADPGNSVSPPSPTRPGVRGSVVVLLIEAPREGSPHWMVIHLPVEAEKHPGQAKLEAQGHPPEGDSLSHSQGHLPERELGLSHPLP